MVDINLLPWREEKNRKDKRTFLNHALICLGIIVLMVVPIHLNYSKKISRQAHRNAELQKEVWVLLAKVQKLSSLRKSTATLEKKIGSLQALQYQRYQIVTLLNEITQLMPKGIFLNKMRQKDSRIILNGHANSHLLISELIKKIDLSQQLFTPTLSDVTTTRSRDGGSITKFQLALQLKSYKPLSEVDKKK